MSVNTSVKDFAAELKVPVDTLLDQLNLAGVPKKSGLDVISEEDKEKLLQTLETRIRKRQIRQGRKNNFDEKDNFRDQTGGSIWQIENYSS